MKKIMLLLVIFHFSLHAKAQLVKDRCNLDTNCTKHILNNYSFELLEARGLPFDPMPCPPYNYIDFSFEKNKVIISSAHQVNCSTSNKTVLAEGTYSLNYGADKKVNIVITKLQKILTLRYYYEQTGKVNNNDESNTYEIRFRKGSSDEYINLIRGGGDNVPEINEFKIRIKTK